jgi:hypothetical protein
MITSKNVGLLHLYNVLQPLAYDSETLDLVEAFRSSNFDDSLLDQNKILVLNLTRNKI